jgi:transcriptional regulator with XRE-family HTH domain
MSTPLTTKTIGQLIKDLRKKKGLTGGELGRRAGLSQSKISKLETGFYPTHNPTEIIRLLNILDAPMTIRQQVQTSLDQSQLDHPGLYRLKTLTEPYLSEKNASYVRVFIYHSVPAILQTIPYRREGLQRYGLPENEIDSLLKDAIKRQDLLWDERRKFHIIMHQAALYNRRVPRSLQLAQLDRVERMMDLPNLNIGIIPVEAGLPNAEHGPFCVFDNEELVMATTKGDIQAKDPNDIEIYLRIFAQLDQLAHYGEEAKAMVREAAAYFARQ